MHVFPDTTYGVSTYTPLLREYPWLCSTEALEVSFSNDSTRYLIADTQGLSVFDSESKETVQVIAECQGARAAAFSPQGNYVVTFHRPRKNEAGVADANLCLWRVSDGKKLLGLTQKNLDRDHWPSIQFTKDEKHCVHQVTNTLHIYDVEACGNGPVMKFPVKGVSCFALNPNATTEKPGSMNVIVYVPETKGSPGHVAMYRLPVAEGATYTSQPAPLSRKSFYRTNSVRFLWNCLGTAVLVVSAADVDATNQSYYGEQKLFYFAGDGSEEMAVPMAKDGPIHDVQWSPKGDYFVAVCGFMPAKSTLYTVKCVPKFDLGSGPYSTIRWNPFGRFFVLAGFGNLPGDLAFYDKKADAKCKLMGSSRASNGVTLSWSPCGRYVLAATTAPRLRVDNGFQLFKYNGTLLAHKKYETIYEAFWRQVREGTFEDRPQTPRAVGAVEPAASTGAAIAQPSKSKGYVPHHLRSKGVRSAPKASFSLARDQEDMGGKIRGGTVSAHKASQPSNLPPGASTPLSKSALKNAKRRAKKKQEDISDALGKATL